MGSYYVKRRNGDRWSVMEESWTDGKRSQKAVPKIAYEALGFTDSMSVDEARERVKILNKKASFEKQKVAKIARRVELDEVVKSIYLPEDLVRQFNVYLDEQSFGSPKHQEKIRSHWKHVQRIIRDMELEPTEYSDNAKKIYGYFVKKAHSLDYTNKLIRILNIWGSFVCKKEGRHFEAVKGPRGVVREKIEETYQESDNYVGESDPLTPKHLEQVRSKLTVPGNYEWLSISVWFGLRPPEVDNLKNSKLYRIEHDHDSGVDVLWIYQTKLTGISKDRRWKGIPVIFPQQQELLEVIRSGEFKRPIYKTMWNVFPKHGKHITLYSGRKGFIDLCLDHGQILEDISMWLGHQNIRMSWSKYRNKKRISFTKAG